MAVRDKAPRRMAHGTVELNITGGSYKANGTVADPDLITIFQVSWNRNPAVVQPRPVDAAQIAQNVVISTSPDFSMVS